MNRHVGDVEFELARLDLGEVQHVVDQSDQHALSVVDAAQILALRVGHLAAQSHLEQVDVAADGVERRAQLVTHVGDELALGEIGRLRLPALLLRFGLCHLGVAAGGALRLV